VAERHTGEEKVAVHAGWYARRFSEPFSSVVAHLIPTRAAEHHKVVELIWLG
jgi:hypothetical protein